MVLTIGLLVVGTLLGGLAAHRLQYRSDRLQLPLVFAGAFLFSITLIHLLPELFGTAARPMRMGIYILLGFFFQQILELFTSGVEHGHFHSHGHGQRSQINLLLALIIHSLMEGAMLTHDSPFHDKDESYSLLIGIILHKAPAAFALMAIFQQGPGFSKRQWLILILFSLASPAGYVASNILPLSQEFFLILFAVVSGAFLHISTTIFVESSPEHHFGWNKLLVSLAGAALAILSEALL